MRILHLYPDSATQTQPPVRLGPAYSARLHATCQEHRRSGTACGCAQARSTVFSDVASPTASLSQFLQGSDGARCQTRLRTAHTCPCYHLQAMRTARVSASACDDYPRLSGCVCEPARAVQGFSVTNRL